MPDRLAILRRADVAVGQNEESQRPAQQLGDGAVAQLGERRQRALQIETLAQQRLAAAGGPIGRDADRAPARLLVDQQGGAGRGLALQLNPPDPVAQLARHRHGDVERAAIGGELAFGLGDLTAVLARGAQPHGRRAAQRRPLDPHGQILRLGRPRLDQMGQVIVARQHQLDRTEAAQHLQQPGHPAPVVEPVGQVEHRGAGRRRQRRDPIGGRHAIGRPGLGRQAGCAAARVGRPQQRGRLARHAGGRGDQHDAAIGAIGLVDQSAGPALHLGPIGRRRPAVIDDQHQRTRTRQGRGRVEQRMRQPQDQ